MKNIKIALIALVMVGVYAVSNIALAQINNDPYGENDSQNEAVMLTTETASEPLMDADWKKVVITKAGFYKLEIISETNAQVMGYVLKETNSPNRVSEIIENISVYNNTSNYRILHLTKGTYYTYLYRGYGPVDEGNVTQILTLVNKNDYR